MICWPFAAIIQLKSAKGQAANRNSFQSFKRVWVAFVIVLMGGVESFLEENSGTGNNPLGNGTKESSVILS